MAIWQSVQKERMSHCIHNGLKKSDRNTLKIDVKTEMDYSNMLQHKNSIVEGNSLTSDSSHRSDTSNSMSPESSHYNSRGRSPPPKPPRRRHSDQSVSNNDLCSYGSPKHSNLKYRQRSAPKERSSMLSTNSGSESLPPSWTTSVPAKQEESEKAFESFNTDFLSSLTKPHRKSLTDADSYCKRHSCKVYSNIWNTATTFCHCPPEKPVVCCSPSIQSLVRRFSKEEKRSLAKDLFIEKLATSDIMAEILNMRSQESSKVAFHRRHHSDPLLSRHSKLAKMSTSASSSSHRSHSFMGFSGSKYLQNATGDTYKFHQYLTVPKDPLLMAEEVRILQNINEKLWQHVCITQAKLDMVQKLQKSSKEPLKGPYFADLLAEIYYAQKERDQAVDARLRIANEEKAVSIKQLDDLLKKTLGRNSEESSEDEESDDKVLEKVIQDLESAQSPARILRHQEKLLANVYKARNLKEHRVSQDFRVLLTERDEALEKVKSLEEELKQWQQSSDMWQADTKQWESSLLETLCQVITERDNALKKVNELQEEMESFRICYNLQTSLSRDRQINSDYESLQKVECLPTCLGDCDDHCTSELASLPDCKTELSNTNDIDQLKAQIKKLQNQWEDESKNRHIAEEKCNRLERLVDVLRKKLNGISVGVPV